MTVPIIPGPFSFLGEAGEALGNIGQVREERKERAQKIAEHASTSILDTIMAGGDPAILDNPETQKIFKTAGYPPVTSAHLKFVGGAQRAAGAAGQARIEQDVPRREAAAAGGVADVSAATSGAELGAGLPQLDAEAKAYQARAASAGAQFNVQVYNAARTRFADVKDPEFKNLAIDAATGVLDYRINRLRIERESFTLERQRMADEARSLLEARKEINSNYLHLVDNYEKQRRQDMITAGTDPNDKKAQDAYDEVHHRPTYEDAQDDMFKSLGITADEYKRKVRTGLGLIGEASADTSGAAGTTTTEQTSTASASYSQAVDVLTNSKDPIKDTQSLYRHLVAGDVDIYNVKLMFAQLRRTIPAAQYKKLRDAYNQAVEDGGAFGRQAEISQ